VEGKLPGDSGRTCSYADGKQHLRCGDAGKLKTNGQEIDLLEGVFGGETGDANKAKHLKPNGIGSEKQAAAASEIWKMLLPRMRHEASASGS